MVANPIFFSLTYFVPQPDFSRPGLGLAAMEEQISCLLVSKMEGALGQPAGKLYCGPPQRQSTLWNAPFSTTCDCRRVTVTIPRVHVTVQCMARPVVRKLPVDSLHLTCTVSR